MSDMHLIPLARLEDAIRQVVRGFGSAPAEVDAVAGNLIEANLTGHDSHGIGMLPRYAKAYLEGGLVPNTHVKVVHDGGAMLRLDGQAGFGQVIGQEATALAIERAKTHGSCIMALGNAHHIGRIGAWAEQAAAAGLVSIHFVNVVSRPIVAPHGGADARLGTNPFCAGVPLRGREPVILDFATSVIAQGKTRVAHNKGELVAADCLLDDAGRPTQVPGYAVVPPFGALLPFGGLLGGHKGGGLSFLCELLGGALAAGISQRFPDQGKMRVLNGMLSIVFDPAGIADPAVFETEAVGFIDWMRSSRVREGFESIAIAGEPERAHRARRRAEGVPVDGTTWREILAAAASLKLDPAAINAAAGLG